MSPDPDRRTESGSEPPIESRRSDANASDDHRFAAQPRRSTRQLLQPALRLAALAVTAATFFWGASLYVTSPADLRQTVESWGIFAPVAYGALGAGLIVAFVPLAVVSGLAGLVFGTALGFPVALIAATAGAGCTFLLARWLGGSAIDELEGARVARMRAWISERGVVAVVVARVAPIPTSLVNYGGGLTTLSLRAFVTGSLLGFMPRVFAYVAVGGALENPLSPAMLGALGLLALIAIIGALILRRNRRASEILDLR